MILRIIAFAIGIGSGVLLFAPQAAPSKTVNAATAPTPANDREAWALDLLALLGNEQPAPATVAFVVEWTLAEDVSDGAFARNNPLNTTQAGFGETHSINGDGVRGYATHADGPAATIQTLSYGYYTEIVAALRANDPARARAALIASPWAASHYGGGADWPHYAIGGVR